MNSLLRLQALVVPRNPLWTAEEEVASDHQSRIANDPAKVHTVPAAPGSVCKWQGTHSHSSGSSGSRFTFLPSGAVLSRVAGVALRTIGRHTSWA